MPINLAHYVARAAQRNPDHPAILHGDVQRSYAWLDDRVGRMAGALLELGLRPGDRVGIVVETEPRSLECLLAPLRAGLVIVPLNHHLHAAEHAFMLSDCGARAVLGSASRVTPLLDVRDRTPALEHVIAMDSAVTESAAMRDYEAVIASAPAVRDAPVSDETLAWIFYTSGTSGRPKGAMHTHRSLGAMLAAQLIDIFPSTPADRLAHMTPMSHAAGLLVFHHTAAGGTHVFPTFGRFEAEAFYAFVDRFRITKASLVPTMIQRLLDGPWPTDRDISSLNTVQYGGAPMYVDPLKEALGRFGRIFVNVYAQGEAPLACTYLPKEEHVAVDAATERRLGSVGRACHGAEVAIHDADGLPLPPGTPGEIVVRGDLVMVGYWNAPDLTNDTLRGGWLRTGDVGYMDQDGYLFLTDRVKDMIIKGGTNIYPREIEEVLHTHPDVAEACVFGIPDPEWGEQVAAAIVLRPDGHATELDLTAWCGREIASFKCPAKIHFLPELAKSGYGKILKREVRSQLYPDAAATDRTAARSSSTTAS